MNLRKNIDKPDIVLGGVPKCGTTSLFNWLNAHPDILGSEPKEPHFFMDENHPLLRPQGNFHKHGIAAYDAYFPPHRAENMLSLEASAHYLYQNTAFDVFSKSSPQPKCIFILRKPSKMIFSAFNYLKNNRAEIDNKFEFCDFIEYSLDHEFNKIKSFTYTEHAFVWLSSLIDYGNYTKWIRLWHESMPGNIKVVVFEDLIAQPKEQVRDILEFLNLSDDYLESIDFSAKNKTETYKFLVIHQFIRRLYLLVSASSLNFLYPTLLKGIYKKIFTSSERITPEVELESLEKLDHYYQGMYESLEDYLNIDLTCWRT